MLATLYISLKTYLLFFENLLKPPCCPLDNSFLIFVINYLAFLHQSFSAKHSTPPKMHPTQTLQQIKCHKKIKAHDPHYLQTNNKVNNRHKRNILPSSHYQPPNNLSSFVFCSWRQHSTFLKVSFHRHLS